MFTASADPHHRADESTAGDTLRRPAARGLRSRSVRTSAPAEPLDPREFRGRTGEQREADFDPGLDPGLDPGFEPAPDPEELDLRELVAGEDAWMAQADCRGRTNLFFGQAGERPERRIRREGSARAMCATCPVVEPCRERARAGRENGFWGGESEEERAAAGFPPRSVSRRSVQRASTVGVAAS
jgi:WhiB family redox-sensing transcriptional regulator